MSRQSREELVAEVARSQYGLVTREQALKRGFTSSAIDRRLKFGHWRRVYPNVYCFAGVPESFPGRLLAACLWAGNGAVVSHGSAARIWELDGTAGMPESVEITVPRHVTKAAPGVVVHRALSLPAQDKTVVKGLPITKLPRTLIDLAGSMPPAQLELALEDAIRRRMMTTEWLWKRLKAPGGRKRHGNVALAKLLDQRVRGKEVTDSALEMRTLQIIRAAGLPEPHCHYNVVEGNRFLGEVDFAYPRLKIAIEAEGRRYHDGLKAWSRDRDRLTNLAAAGWRVLYVKWEDVTRWPDETRDKISRAYKAGLVALPRNS